MVELLARIERAVVEAGAEILAVYASDFAVARKRDASPVTLADGKAEAVILRRLAEATPDIPIISEEQAEENGLPDSVPTRYWLVDPLDGTKEFVARNGEFTVNIGLIEDGRPILGVVGVPAKGLVYAGAGPGTARVGDGSGDHRPIKCRPCPSEGATVICSRSHADNEELEAWLAERRVARRLIAGSAYKFCALAEGTADLYPRFRPTMEWDTAAGQALLEAAGGSVSFLDGTPFRYGKPGFLNPGFIAAGDPSNS
ncbi:MAG TPA: 3'(2'),5'-bisphosphate nucleotidase CysQ [Aliidongia sp.]|nr:3'(2'),5'-bisphosphate nucleotidase CysQ [Aliidongia sp.]